MTVADRGHAPRQSHCSITATSHHTGTMLSYRTGITPSPLMNHIDQFGVIWIAGRFCNDAPQKSQAIWRCVPDN